MEEDFNPNSAYEYNLIKEDWDFEARERDMDEQFNQGLRYKSRVILNITKKYPK